MTLKLDALSAPAQRVLSDKAPLPMKMLGARGVVPGASPADALSVVVALSQSEDAKLAAAALETLKSPPKPLLEGALSAQLQLIVVAALAGSIGTDVSLLPRLLAQQSLDEDVLCSLAARATEASGEVLATNEALLLRFPAAIEKLYMNKRVRMSTSDRIVELAVRNKLELEFPAFRLAAQAIMNQLIPEPTEELTFDDIHFLETEEHAKAAELGDDEDVIERDEEGEEHLVDKALPLFKQLQDASISEKVRRAMLGNSVERLLLVRDTNRLVSEAAARSPRMTENDAARIAASRAVSDDVLRIIANNRELTRSYQVKLNLITNPRTPFTFTSRLMPHLRLTDLKALSRSKNVPGAVQKVAKLQLARRK